MRLYVAVTDKDWFAVHASKQDVEEVNFWRPSPDAVFKAAQPSDLLLFKLHSPDNFIAGAGFLTRFLQFPPNLVWDTFGEVNGVRSQSEIRERIAFYRRSPIAATENPIRRQLKNDIKVTEAVDRSIPAVGTHIKAVCRFGTG